jgi:hypothetical protein
MVPSIGAWLLIGGHVDDSEQSNAGGYYYSFATTGRSKPSWQLLPFMNIPRSSATALHLPHIGIVIMAGAPDPRVPRRRKPRADGHGRPREESVPMGRHHCMEWLDTSGGIPSLWQWRLVHWTLDSTDILHRVTVFTTGSPPPATASISSAAIVDVDENDRPSFAPAAAAAISTAPSTGFRLERSMRVYQLGGHSNSGDERDVGLYHGACVADGPDFVLPSSWPDTRPYPDRHSRPLKWCRSGGLFSPPRCASKAIACYL